MMTGTTGKMSCFFAEDHYEDFDDEEEAYDEAADYGDANN